MDQLPANPDDAELKALTTCYNRLKAFDHATQNRMLVWLGERLTTDRIREAEAEKTRKTTARLPSTFES